MSNNQTSNNVLLENGEVISKIVQNIDFVCKYKDEVEKMPIDSSEKEIIYRELGSIVLSAIEAIMKVASLTISNRCNEKKCGEKPKCNYYRNKTAISKLKIKDLVDYFSNTRFIYLSSNMKDNLIKLKDLRNYVHLSKYLDIKKQEVVFNKEFVDNMLLMYDEIYDQLSYTDWYTENKNHCLKEIDEDGFESTAKMNRRDYESFICSKCNEPFEKLINNKEIEKDDEWYLYRMKDINNIDGFAKIIARRIAYSRNEYKNDNDYEKHEDELFKTMINKYAMNNLVAMVQEELKNYN